MAGQECAYYRSQVIREYYERDLGDDDIGPDRRSETIASNERFAPFAVEDGSGAVGVRGEGAEVDALEVMNRFERDTQGGITIGGLP
jgi:E3 Ubiquitin ligase